MEAQPKFDKETLRKEYEKICPGYERFASLLVETLEMLLRDKEVQYLHIDYRIKQFDSLWEKISRKDYTKPFEETEDICGIHILCFYNSDIEKITKMIKEEFNILNWGNKECEMPPNQFGFRSSQGVIKIKDEWLSTPHFRGFGNLKAEIQVQTLIMFAWANAEHNIVYKSEEEVSWGIKRKYARLSAQMEAIDEQLDSLRKIHLTKVNESIRFIKSLFEFHDLLNQYFPSREIDYELAQELLCELFKLKISISDIVRAVKKTYVLLPLIEEEYYGKEEVGNAWSQEGCVKIALGIVNESYWDSIKEYTPSVLPKWREKIVEVGDNQ